MLLQSGKRLRRIGFHIGVLAILSFTLVFGDRLFMTGYHVVDEFAVKRGGFHLTQGSNHSVVLLVDALWHGCTGLGRSRSQRVVVGSVIGYEHLPEIFHALRPSLILRHLADMSFGHVNLCSS